MTLRRWVQITGCLFAALMQRLIHTQEDRQRGRGSVQIPLVGPHVKVCVDLQWNYIHYNHCTAGIACHTQLAWFLAKELHHTNVTHARTHTHMHARTHTTLTLQSDSMRRRRREREREYVVGPDERIREIRYLDIVYTVHSFVHRPQLFKRKESRRGFEPRSLCLPAEPAHKEGWGK